MSWEGVDYPLRRHRPRRLIGREVGGLPTTATAAATAAASAAAPPPPPPTAAATSSPFGLRWKRRFPFPLFSTGYRRPVCAREGQGL
jgi:hypothetical protein